MLSHSCLYILTPLLSHICIFFLVCLHNIHNLIHFYIDFHTIFFVTSFITFESVLVLHYSECGVTANIPVLGTGDSGFESRHSDFMAFKRVKEDFVCDKCGLKNIGTGYTNHCSNCLWSKHVDNSPGDRASLCHGLMEPILVEFRGGEYVATHKCLICGHMKNNKLSLSDNFDQAAKLAKAIADRV